MTNLDNDPARLRRRVTAAETLIVTLHGENERLRSAAEWQPIAKAPKSAAFIIGWWPGSHIAIPIYWDDDNWVDGEGDEVGPPTFWIPMPPLPKDQ